MEPFVAALVKGEYHKSFLYFDNNPDPIQLRMLGFVKCLISGYGVKSVVPRNITLAMVVLNAISIMAMELSTSNLFASNCSFLTAAGVLSLHGDPLTEEKPWVLSACWMVANFHHYNELLLDIYTLLTVLLISWRMIVGAHPVAFIIVTIVILFDAYVENYLGTPSIWYIELIVIVYFQTFIADIAQRIGAQWFYQYYFYLCFLLAVWDVLKISYLTYSYRPEYSTSPYFDNSYKKLMEYYEEVSQEPTGWEGMQREL